MILLTYKTLVSGRNASITKCISVHSELTNVAALSQSSGMMVFGYGVGPASNISHLKTVDQSSYLNVAFEPNYDSLSSKNNQIFTFLNS